MSAPAWRNAATRKSVPAPVTPPKTLAEMGAEMAAAMIPVMTPATITYVAVRSRPLNSSQRSPATVPTIRARPQPPEPAEQAGQEADDGRDDREGTRDVAVERRRDDVGPEHVGEEPGQRPRDRSGERADQDGPDGVEVDGDLERGADRL